MAVIMQVVRKTGQVVDKYIVLTRFWSTQPDPPQAIPGCFAYEQEVLLMVDGDAIGTKESINNEFGLAALGIVGK